MRFTFSRCPAFVVALVGGYAALLGAPPLARLVSEDAAVVMLWHKVPELSAAINASPLGKMTGDEQIRRFFAPLREQLKWDEMIDSLKERTGYTLEQLIGLVEGDVLVALNDFSHLLDVKTQNQPPLIVAVEVGTNSGTVERLLKEHFARQVEEGSAQVTEETFSGAVLHLVQPIRKDEVEGANPNEGAATTAGPAVSPPALRPFAWAVVDGLWVLSPVKEALMQFVDAIQRGGHERPLERAARYVGLQERTGQHQFCLLVHVPPILPSLQTAFEMRDPSEEPPPMGVDLTRIISTLGLDAWGDFYLTSRIDDDATVSHYGLTTTDVRGLLKLAEPGEGAFPKPAWIPAQWTSVSSFRYDLKSAYKAFESILRAVSPQLEGVVQGSISQLNKQANLDLKRDLVGSFGDVVVQAQFVGAEEGSVAGGLQTTGQLYAVSLGNAPALERSIVALKRLAGPAVEKAIVAREYLGQTIHGMTPAGGAGGPTPGPGFHYAITDRTLFVAVGAVGPLEAALQNLDGRGDSFWEKPGVRTALACVPDSASAFQYQDVAVLVSAMFEAWSAQASAARARGNESSVFTWVDPTEKPGMDVLRRYWGENVTYSFRDADGFHMVTRLAQPQP